MSSLIVIRIIPESPVDPNTFTSYLMSLKIEAFDLSFDTVDDQPPGLSVGTASFIAPTSGWTVVLGHPDQSSTAPVYPSPATNGIVQQVDYNPPFLLNPPYYQFESVAIAIIEVSSPSPKFENLRLAVTSGSQTIPVAIDYYNVTLSPGPIPDPGTWVALGSNFPDSWAALSPSLYISIPAPATPSGITFQLPTDGTPPSFDSLLTVVQKVLTDDPGTAFTATTTAAAAAGSTALQFAATTEIVAGMAASGAGIPNGTTVVAVTSAGLVTLSQEVSGTVPSGTPITFTPDLGTLTFEQCRNIAYEIIWSQQPALPAPPSGDPLEDLYTNPPNNGTLLSGTTPNQQEGDRQQFEAQLKSYYALADSTADRLTNFVYSLSAAVACEQLSLAATLALLQFPVNPGQPSAAPLSETEVILSGLGSISPPTNFGVPAAYFYALSANMPTQTDTTQRYQYATGSHLQSLLTDLTSAINAGTVTDSEEFTTAAPAKINAAQAARRISALGIPTGSKTPLAPLDTVGLLTSANTASGNSLPFSSTAGISTGMSVSGAYIANNTTVSAVTSTAVTLSQAILGAMSAGSSVVFTPPYPTGLQPLIQSWLAYPPAVSGVPSSQAYQPADDATEFWPPAATAQPGAFLNLVLCSLTQGYIIPAPFNVALGDKIIQFLNTLTSPPTVATLASVTVQQWTQFFQTNPTWLPPSPGSVAARIAAFIHYAQKFFVVATNNLASSIILATDAPTTAGNNVLQFASTAGITAPTLPPTITWSVSGTDIPLGTTVVAVTPTTVTLSQPVAAGGVANNANIVFTPNFATGTLTALPVLQAPSTDWLTACLGFYGPYILGSGFNLANLKTAAASVFPGDQAAQDWLVDALVTIDALYQVMKTVALPPPPPPLTTANLEFSIVEALYARGFKSAADMTELSSSDFQQALIGTVAYDLAGLIYASAAVIAPPAPTTPPPGGFEPVNPGSLTNCIPPPCLLPLGPIAYLNEMLQVSPSSTCETPLTPTAANTLATVVGARRGPVGNLSASCANLQTPLPLIDIVNECLEFMGSLSAPTDGTVYDTSADALAGHVLCDEEDCPDKEKPAHCHEPARIFATLPEYSTPATPVAANNAVEPLVYNKLKTDFSSCCLPYSQAIDVSRTYLRHFRTCRFEEMRTFRKCITEFVLDPVNEPTGFQTHLWRYPVRIDTAIEYLGITPEEYQLLFLGTPAQPCAGSVNPPPGNGTPGTPPPNTPPGNPSTGNPPTVPTPSGPQILASASLTVWQLYGFDSPGDNNPWTQVVVQVPEFLQRTCLTYCEFLELWKCGFVSFRNGSDERNGMFPNCEPCCLDKLWIQFPESPGAQIALLELAVFIRLWRKLKESDCFCYSFDQLRDICDVLHLFNGGVINPDFIRQFAAFQMFRDHFHMELVDPEDETPPAAIDADRTHLLALWVGPTAAKWHWAVKQLLERIERFALRRHKCDRRTPEFIKLLASNLDPLSRLAGFDPASATDNWHALPTHTLRFAEVLAKIYASNFSIGEIVYLFTADEHLDGDDPFPLQEVDEALDSPLGLPDDEPKFSLWHLRRRLLETHVADEDVEEWHWKRIEAALQNDFGFALADVLALGRHFFPVVLEHAGYQVDSASTRYFSSLPAASTSAPMWNTPADGPLQYDPLAAQLWTRLPLTDEAVIAKLTHVHSLNADEQKAVQDLYFQPRAMLAAFVLLFSDFSSAEKHLIEEREERERWSYFRKQFILCHRRCRIIAEHLSHHVAAMTGQECPEGEAPALLILRELFADENKATADWENDAGTTPPVTWTPLPEGGAFAALLGLTGTGLIAEYKPEGGAVVWREVSGPLSAFGRERDKENCPVPTVLPSMSATLTPQQMQFVSVHNGFLMKDATGAWLGGAQGLDVKWSGALLVDHEGTYEFWAGAPTPGDEKPDWEAAEHRKWRVILKRGQRTWILLSHHWPGEEEHRSSSLLLRPGAYELTVELLQPTPDFHSDEQVHPQRSGFQVKYSGPDSDERRTEIPHHRLFSALKNQTLGEGIAALSPGAASFLSQFYTSSLRDIRRTYQRAFKALLFVHRFALSDRRRDHGTSELAYMLAQKVNFAGAAYYRTAGGFVRHAADFDFNFLPLRDDYHPPTQDSRAHPSQQRMQAMFDWWERIFDYTMVRKDVHQRCDRHLWHLFEEAEEKQPAHPAYLLRHMGADSRHWHLDLRYYQGQAVPVYAVSSIDLEDDRWTVRAWHADQWIRALQCFFAAKDITVARPDLWASDDPSALVAGETETGNANLSAFLCDGCFENGEPRRYEDVKRLNDGLRERGRNALLAYLCHMNRVALPWVAGQFAKIPRDLSDLLLLDVETGICERASRIEEAITAVQNFVRRARLQLEPGWTITREFARMWDREFATFHVWQACKRRHLYKENSIEWNDLEKARGVEAFRFLESKLRSSELTVAVPGGLEWWPDERPPAHKSLEVLQKREPSDIQILPTPIEGLNLLGTPERDARPSWLAAVQSDSGSNQNNSIPSAGGSVPAKAGSGAGATPLPFWMEAAIRLGMRFYRVAAAGVPPAAMGFEPHKKHGGKDCVSCCQECGCIHPALVDEYYFWLIDGFFYEPPSPPSGVTTGSPDDYQYGYQDDFYDSGQQESAFWQDTTQLPLLLEWQPVPMVRLAWCRVHNGEFQQPRRSHKGVQVAPGTANDLSFWGRTEDSLIFSVSNAIPPEGYSDPSEPGFRYDLATDNAVVLPLITPTPPLAPTPLKNLLPAYPYFVYDAPGTHLFPLSLFSPAIAVAQALRSHCRFEAALKWYGLAFDPLQQDCTWVHCADDTIPTPPPNNPPGTPTNPTGGGNTPTNPTGGPNNPPHLAATTDQPPSRSAPAQGACCDSTDVSCAVARNRSIILHYVETLVEWGEAVMRRGNSPEAFQQARLIFDTATLILGKTPYSVRLPEPAIPPTVSAFKPAFAPLNPRLLDLYDLVRDRLHLIRACMDSRRLHTGRPNCEMPYFGNNPLREGWRTNLEPCADETEWCYPHSPYRFMFLIQKAQEYATKVEALGAALLAAFEKGDAEYLASLRAGHERELLTLGLEAKKDQWRDADWQIEALQDTKAVSQANLVYTNGLISAGPDGLINDEIAYQDLTIASTVLRGAGNISEALAEGAGATPNTFTGIAGFGGTPLLYEQIPIGTPLAGIFSSAARIMNSLAEIASSTAGLSLTQAGWQRRLDEWTHQTQTLKIEIQQIERQILGAQRRRDLALQELNSHRRQMEQSAEVQNFLRDKFTAHDLYLFLQKETAALYYKTYDLALYAARQAQHAFNLERGHTTRHFIPECAWDNLHDGLMAGERLSVALRQMEKAYLDHNVREYELTKNFSLRLHFPVEFLRLRTTGRCEIDIPEWMFDLDYPGQYMRRIKNVTLTIPCVTGPYTGVHCKMTLISSMTRVDPRLSAPPHDCCCPPEPCGCECCHDERLAREYTPCPDDPRIVRHYAAREAIATSTGQNDSGMFELNFNDERYLPFEYMGAVSRWRIELPPENNYFELHTLSDLVLRLNHTAREGGEPLRHAANQAAQRHLPGDGWCFFDVRHEFPNAWQLFRDSAKGKGPARRLGLRFDRKMFPFVPGAREVWIDKMAILFATREHGACCCPEIEGCPCPEPGEPARHVVEFSRGREDREHDREHDRGLNRDHDPECELSVSCLASDEWPDLYCGIFHARVGPLGVGSLSKDGHCRDVEFRFPSDCVEVERIFLLCHYTLGPCAGSRHDESRFPGRLREVMNS